MQLGSEDKELGQASVNRWLTWLNSMDDQTEPRTAEDGRTRPGLDKRTRTLTSQMSEGRNFTRRHQIQYQSVITAGPYVLKWDTIVLK